MPRWSQGRAGSKRALAGLDELLELCWQLLADCCELELSWQVRAAAVRFLQASRVEIRKISTLLQEARRVIAAAREERE